jgi:hypothetical protein
MTDADIDERARQMTDAARNAYLLAHGWQNVGAGWIPGGGTEHHVAGGVIRTMDSGLYSRSTAIREQLAREDPDAVPNELGRYYHGTVKSHTGRW